jgi:hypothetical protein
MRVSPTYRAARVHHIDRLGMTATMTELRRMRGKLTDRIDFVREMLSGAEGEVFAEMQRRSLYPLLRTLEIIEHAQRVAAERKINNAAIARRAARRGQEARRFPARAYERATNYRMF